MPNSPDDVAPGRLQLRQPRLDDVRLLAAFEQLAMLPDPFLAFENQVCKLIARLENQEFQQGQPEQQVLLDVFVIFCGGQRALQHVAEHFAECTGVRAFSLAQFDPREIRRAGALPDQLK